MIRHDITFTVYAPSYNARIECKSQLYRKRPLTLTGCQRILRAGRKPTPGEITVTRVEKSLLT